MCWKAHRFGESALEIVELLCSYGADPEAGRKSDGALCTLPYLDDGILFAFPIHYVAKIMRSVRFEEALSP